MFGCHTVAMSDAWVGLLGVLIGGGMTAATSWLQARAAHKRQVQRDVEARNWQHKESLYLDLIEWSGTEVVGLISILDPPQELLTRTQAFASAEMYLRLLQLLNAAQKLFNAEGAPEEVSVSDDELDRYRSDVARARRRIVERVREEFGATDRIWLEQS